MRYRVCATVSMLLLASAAMAQSVPPAPSSANDNWSSHPAEAATTFVNGHSAMEAPKSKEHFKFKDRSMTGPASEPPPSANDKASVMGKDRDWQNGRPPVDCAQSPHSSGCP
ncbi:MAG TPA: hypothetical protein VGC19_00490 [Rhodanobacter sp.]